MSSLITPSPSPSPTPTPTPTKKVARTPAPSIVATATPVIAPTIISVTPYTTTEQPSPGWWIKIFGTLPSSCTELVNPSFYRDGNSFFVTLPVQLSSGECMKKTFTQSISIAPASIAAGIYTVYVNDKQWTSFIIESPTPTPTPSPLY
jgi:hypothetical protein